MRLLKQTFFLLTAFLQVTFVQAQTALFTEGFSSFPATSPHTVNYPLLNNASWSWSGKATVNTTAANNGTGTIGCIALGTNGSSEILLPTIGQGGVGYLVINARYFASGSPAGAAANQVELQKMVNGSWVKIADLGMGLNGTTEYTVSSYTLPVNDASANLSLRLYYNPTGTTVANARIHDISLYQSELTYTPDAPIEPWTMKGMIGRGFDVRWAEFSSDINCYSLQQVQDFAAKGFKNVRIRTNQKTPVVSEQPTEALRTLIRSRIDDALSCGMIPILAMNIDDFETVYETNDPALITQAMKRDSIWWATLADWCKDYTHKVLFNINIEWTGAVKKDIETMNRYYEVVTPGIRKTNPTRIIFFSPGNISDPNYLQYMKIPASAGHYVMAEWHLYAAGPSEDGNKGWTTGTPEEKQPIIDKMNVAKAWEEQTNIPTWVGAWMAGNANKGNSFTAERQAGFAAFMVSEFTRINTPWSINANHLYYDCSQNQWIDSMKIVLDVLSPLTPDVPSSLPSTVTSGDQTTLIGHTLHRTDSEPATITLYDLSGRLLLRTRWESDTYPLPQDRLPAGIYTVWIENRDRNRQVVKYRIL